MKNIHLSMLCMVGVFILLSQCNSVMAQRPFLVMKTTSCLKNGPDLKSENLELLYPGNWQQITRPVIYVIGEDGIDGYVVGTNTYGDLAKGQLFKVDEPYEIHGAFFWVGVLEGTTGQVDFCIWSFDEEPKEKKVSVGVSVSEISASEDVAESFYVAFDPPLLVESDYLIGIDISEIGTSEIALYTSLDGDGDELDLTWEQWSDGDWNSFWSSYELDVDIGIFPTVSYPDSVPGIPELHITTIINWHVSCFGGHDALVTASATGGMEPYTWLWSNGQQTDVAYDLAAGTYQVTLTDDLGDKVQAEVTITEPLPLDLALTTTNPTTYGGSNGTAMVTVAGGASPYTYQWNDPGEQQTQTINDLAAGTYIVLVTDSNECHATAIATLTSPAPYPEIAYDALAIHFTSGAVEIIPITDVRIVQFDFATSVDALSISANTLMAVSNYPNPFSHSTNIEFALDRPGRVQVMIYDITGRMVRILSIGDGSPGHNSLLWDGRDDGGGLVHSGVYMVRLLVDNQIASHRMLLVK